jgi:hypothetical protein
MLICETSDGEVVAAHLTLYGKKSTVTWSTARVPSFNLRGPNALLYYNEFFDLKSRILEYMNVMSANVPRFTDFIMGFSPKRMPYYSVTMKSKKYSILGNLYKVTTEALKI